MSASCQFYLDQAALCAQSAARATLANQRETFARAGAAWQALADREIAIAAAREKRDAERIARQSDGDVPAPDNTFAGVFGAVPSAQIR